MGPRYDTYGLRLSDEEKKFLHDKSEEIDKPISFIIRQGLELYFQLESDKICKLNNIKVWKE